MAVTWLHPNPDGNSWTLLTYVEETARNADEVTTTDPATRIMHTEPAPGKFKAWFVVNLQPDGVCMQCRQRPGLQDPISRTYTCPPCQAVCDAAMERLYHVLRRPA